jgi:hypothetical protein
VSRALDLVTGSCEQGEADAFKRVVGRLIAEIDTHALVPLYCHYIDLAPPKLRESLEQERGGKA